MRRLLVLLACLALVFVSAADAKKPKPAAPTARYDLMQNFGGAGGNLSAALAWLASNPQPGGSFVRSGTYQYSNVLDIPAGADIQFQSVTLLPQVIQTEAIRVRGNGTRLDFTGNSRIGHQGRVCGYNGDPSCPRYGNAEASGLLFEGATNAYVHADNLTIEGMGSVGVFLYRRSSFVQFWGTISVTGSGEDSYHVTDGSHDINFYAHLNSYSSGDASFAVVSYVGNPNPVYNVYWADVWAAGQRWSVGIEVGGGHDITVHSYYIQDSAGAGIYVTSESAAAGDGYDLMSVDHVHFDSGQIVRPNRLGIHRSNVEIYNNHAGYTIDDVVVNCPWWDPNFYLWARDGTQPVTNTYVNG
jgi:hypothetical protein